MALAALCGAISFVEPVGAATGLVPLVDLGANSYEGYEGGLYPGGSNTPPAGHATAAAAAAARIVPRNAAGNPDPNGFIVMIAVGMSNTTHEFAVFERNADADPGRNARVVLMDTAFGGQTAAAIANPSAGYWTTMQQRLAAMGLSAEQVQVAWIKEADANPPDDFPGHAQALRAELEAVVNNLHDLFPNLALAYLSSRVYGGYAAPGTLNPEPQAYESGFAVKWLIGDQIGGDPGLNFGQLPGPVRAPLLLWGPYLWADGTTPRSDGLTWLVTDFEGDHTHPSLDGEEKVASLLADFFASEPTAAAWWPAQGDAVLATIDARDDASVRAASPGSNFGGEPLLLEQGTPSPANVYLAFDYEAAGRPALLAKLSLRVAQGGGGNVSRVDDTSWDEGTLTWSGAPSPVATLVSMPQSSRDGTIAANVTADVNQDPDGVATFLLSFAGGAGQGSYLSKEGGQPPRLVLVLPTACAGAPDPDGDQHSDPCDCDPADGSAFSVPAEIGSFRFASPGILAWDSATVASGTGTRYDVMTGDLAEVALTGTGPGDVCRAAGIAVTTLVDPAPAPSRGRGTFYLVRGGNACGDGRWRTTSSGQDRLTSACP
jgi:hypothetical protein